MVHAKLLTTSLTVADLPVLAGFESSCLPGTALDNAAM